jgi:hypothetical protein
MSRQLSDSDDVVKVQITLNKRRFPETYSALEGCDGKIRSERVKKMLEEYCSGRVFSESSNSASVQRDTVPKEEVKQKTITNTVSYGLREQLSSF